MNKYILMNLTAMLSGCVLAVPPSTKITLQVSNSETSETVSNAVVHTGYTLKNDPWGEGVGKSIRIEKTVDENGVVELEGNTISDERGGTIIAAGYYTHTYGLKYKLNPVLNRWEPWNPLIEIKMRPKCNPVPMVFKSLDWTLGKKGQPAQCVIEAGVSPIITSFLFAGAGCWE